MRIVRVVARVYSYHNLLRVRVRVSLRQAETRVGFLRFIFESYMGGGFHMASAKGPSRVNGKNGEYMSIEKDQLCFKTGGEVRQMPLESVAGMDIANAEDARNAVTTEDLVPYGAWTAEMPSVGGKSVFVLTRGRSSLWVMEINKSQVPNASSFVSRALPKDGKDDEDRFRIPNRVINTPLGGLFTIGSIACLFLAIFLVFTWNQPILGLIAAVAAVVMYFNIK
jgi:hypothetical protein